MVTKKLFTLVLMMALFPLSSIRLCAQMIELPLQVRYEDPTEMEDNTHGLPVRPVISGTSKRFKNETNNIIHEKSFADDTIHAIYNICGIKVNDVKADMGTLPPGIYIINGRKVVVK